MLYGKLREKWFRNRPCRIFTRLLLLILAVHWFGYAARCYRNQVLRSMVETAIQALDDEGFEPFLDWSTLLGQWRQNGFLYDEEDVDLGVVLPAGRDEADVERTVRTAFSRGGYRFDSAPGIVYVIPPNTRLHLDMYLVRADLGSSTLVPEWPDRPLTDSHVPSVHPRPWSGREILNSWPVPAQPERYLRSIFGYLGYGAKYDPGSGLYVERSDYINTESGWFRYLLSTSWLSDYVQLIIRDVYFVVIMLPLSEEFRQGIEEHTRSWEQSLLGLICSGSSLRDCA